MKSNKNRCFGLCLFFPKKTSTLVSSTLSLWYACLFIAPGDKQDKVKQKAFVEPYFKVMKGMVALVNTSNMIRSTIELSLSEHL